MTKLAITVAPLIEDTGEVDRSQIRNTLIMVLEGNTNDLNTESFDQITDRVASVLSSEETFNSCCTVYLYVVLPQTADDPKELITMRNNEDLIQSMNIIPRRTTGRWSGYHALCAWFTKKRQRPRPTNIVRNVRPRMHKEANQVSNAIEERPNDNKCSLFYMNGHDLCTTNDDLYVNVLDMGMKELLQTKMVNANTLFQTLLEEWSSESGVPICHVSVWNYTERKNKTLRPNREIKVDLNEEFKENVAANHLKKKVQSVYDRIGDILEKKRMFMLLDDRKIAAVEPSQPTEAASNDNNNGKKILIALKFFDFLTQKLYFVDWMFIPQSKKITFSDIAQYIEHRLVSNTQDDRIWMQQLGRHHQLINEFEANQPSDDSDRSKEKTFIFYEEEAVIGQRCNVIQYEYNHDAASDFYCGDIFVFQLNPYHPYFKASPSMNVSQLNDEFASRGIYWYPMCPSFIEGRVNLVNIQLTMRETTGWKRWSEALLLHNTNNVNSIPPDLKVETEHKWQMQKRATFGMIRRKLGSYYNINPHHIEIWLPSQNPSGDEWDYGSKGRGEWDAKLNSISRNKSQWQRLCPLKFEIQPYNVKEFDEMTRYHDYNSSRIKRVIDFDTRIKDLAMFNFEFVGTWPYQTSESNPITMTISYNKEWSAKDIIQHLLKEATGNALFARVFFSNVIQYIKKHETELTDQTESNSSDDILMLQGLNPNRFLIVENPDNKLPTQFHMDARYKMPEKYSPIKYTDFMLFFLAQNDPLVIQSTLETHNEEAATKTEVQAAAPPTTKALWVFIRKQDINKRLNLLRILLEKGQTLKDAVVKHCLSYLNTTNHNVNENSDDALFESIIEKYKFVMKSGATDSTPLKRKQMESDTIFDELDASMHLHIIIRK